MARINIFNITHNPSRPKAYRLKWTIDDRHKSRSFKSRGEAEKFKRKLEQALEDGYNFDPNSGLQVSMPPLNGMSGQVVQRHNFVILTQ